ncbi:MAG: energy transducer TonB [Candidatus Acidiferrales bacterium]
MRYILKQRSRFSALWKKEGIDVYRPRNPWGSELQLRHKMHRVNSALAAEELSWAIFFLFSVFLVVTSIARAQEPTPAPAYTLKPTPKTVAWGYYDAKTPPALRVKSGDTLEFQTPIPPVPPQEEKRPIIYVKHLDLPHYPPLARQTRVGGTVVMKLKIAAGGTVLGVESSASSLSTNSEHILELFKADAEKTVRTWTFGCAGCPPNAPYEYVIKFNYKQDDSMHFDEPDRFVMDLPDELAISAAPIMIDHGGPAKKPKKGNN